MSNINVRVVGTANVAQMQGSFGKLQAQVAALNTQLAQMVNLNNAVDPAGFQRMAKAAALNNQVFRAGVASTGMFEQQQLRVNRATDDYINKLTKQKMSFRELAKARKIANAAYKEQLAMEQMMVRQGAQATSRGRQVLDVAYPRAVSTELDTASRRLAFFNEQLKSGATQMVNWGKNTQWAGRQLMVGFTMPVAAFGAAAGVMAYQVDKQLTRIAKVYDTTANANSSRAEDMIAVEKELAALREAGTQTAITSAQQYGSAIKDTLDVQSELAATGLKGADLQQSTAEVMRISRLGELDYQDAVKASISLQTVFRMSTNELTEAFNYMNSIENATSLTTQDFAQAIPIAAAPIREFGGDIEELGILLTAMKSRGIEATQGANAIKAAMQRLGRPSKQVAAEFKAITGADISQLVDTSDSLTEIFQRLREETKGLEDSDRRDVFAGLFGSYQVTRMSALVDGMADLENGYGQVQRAQDIANQSSVEWAKTADREIKRYQESISGRFEIALRDVQAQLATLGEPFVQIATYVLKGISSIIKAFNELPSAAKIAIAGAIGIAALAGPLVMLAGLFANLTGNLLKGIAAFTGMFVKMNILSAESRAAKLATDLATSGFISERTAVQQLTVELNKLAAAQAQANAVTRNFAAQQTAMMGPMMGPARPTNKQWEQMYFDSSPGRDKNGRMVSTGLRLQEARNKLANEYMVANGQVARDTATTAGQTRQMNKYMAGAAVSGGVMAASMATMMLTSNETANSIAQYAMLGAIVVPAAQMLVPLLRSAATAAWAGAAGLMAQARAATLARGGMAGFAVAGRGALAAIAGMMGPVGWITAALAAAAFTMYKINKNTQEAIKEHIDAQKELNSAAEKYASHISEAYREWKKIEIVGIPEAQYSEYQQDVQYYSESEEGKKVTDAFSELSESQQNVQAVETYVDLVARAGLSADRAGTSIAAMWQVGAGIDAVEANRRAQEIVDKYGELKDFDWRAVIANARSAMDIALNQDDLSTITNSDDFEEMAKEEGKKIAGAFSEAFATAQNPAEATEMFAALEDAAMASWDKVYEHYMNSPVADQWKEMLEQLGVESAQDLANWYRDTGEKDALIALTDALGARGMEVNEMLRTSNMAETAIVQTYARDYASLGDEITTVTELQDNFNIAARMLSFKDAKTEVKSLMDDVTGADDLTGALFDTAEAFGADLGSNADKMRQMLAAVDPEEIAQLEAALKAFANAHDIKIGKDAVETYYNILRNVKNEVQDTTAEVKRLVTAFSMTGAEAAGIQKDAMAGVQEDIADDIRNSFDDRMTGALDARQDMWDKRADAQQESFDRAQDALDAKWETKKDNAEKYWDRRIDRINDAIEAEEKAEDKRQKMFDAEMSRISRLNEAMNRNIDFNVAINEGNFDEAAKIRNDISAGAAQTTLESAAASSGERSDRRRERLDGRVENVEAARDEFMDRLDKREEAERKSLEAMQQRRDKALRAEIDADMAAQRDIWENRRESLDQQLDMFLSFTARNEKELKKHMESVGLSFKDFGEKTLAPMGETWGSYFGTSLRRHIRDAGLALKSDKMWKQMGEGATKEILAGMGFPGGMPQFRQFLRTGEIVDVKKKKPKPGDPGFIGPVMPETRHEGGFVGDGAGSRSGVARTTKGLHSSEKMIRAQKGEFVVNRKAAEANADVLNDINSNKSPGSMYGTDIPPKNSGGIGSGPAALLMAAAARGFVSGAAQAMNNAFTAQKAQSVSTMGTPYSGVPGNKTYSLPGVKPWVYEAAQYLGNKYNIGTIGGVGQRSNYSEHPLGRALDFMVSDDRGTSLADEVVKLHEPLDAMYVIWRQRINSFDGRGWRAMEDRGDPTANHFDHVHVSFDPTGDTGDLPSLTNSTGGSSGGSFVQGGGGRHRPVAGGSVNPRGIHYNNALDISVGRGTPVYAIADGTVSRSYDIPGPLPTDDYNGDGPYGSYGRVIEVSHGPFSSLYAHLSQRFASAGQNVKGGAKIGLSGSTGNSSGPHLHFGVVGNNPYAFLKKGGTVKKDGTPAILHKDERVLTAPLTRKLDEGIDAIHRSTTGKGGKGKGDELPYTLEEHNPSRGKKKKPKKTPWSYPELQTGLADSPYTWFDIEEVLQKGMANSSTNNKAFSVRTGTYNLLNTTSNAASRADLERIMPKADVLSLTEFVGDKRLLTSWLEQKGWGVSGRGGVGRDSAVIYNKQNIELVKSGSYKLNEPDDDARQAFGGSHFASRYAAYALLRDKKSGSEFWQVAAHTIAHSKHHKQAIPVQIEQYKALNELYDKLSETAPVFMGGDFNPSALGVKGLLSRTGLKSGRKTGLDHVLFDGDMKLKGQQLLNAGLASDHPAYLAQFSIPGLKVGGTVQLDNTIANLHKGERVLTAPLTKKLDTGIDNLANGGSTIYNVNMVVNEAQDGKKLFKEFKAEMKREEGRKPGSRRA